MKKMILVFLIVGILVIIGAVVFVRRPSLVQGPQDNRKTENLYPDLIRVYTPKENETIRSPLRVTGEARGNWYFEANFPIRLYTEDGKEIAVAIAQAQGEWMTTEFVPFLATLSFPAPTTEKGILVLEKDNPSGLPENEAQIRIPIQF